MIQETFRLVDTLKEYLVDNILTTKVRTNKTTAHELLIDNESVIKGGKRPLLCYQAYWT